MTNAIHHIDNHGGRIGQSIRIEVPFFIHVGLNEGILTPPQYFLYFLFLCFCNHRNAVLYNKYFCYSLVRVLHRYLNKCVNIFSLTQIIREYFFYN